MKYIILLVLFALSAQGFAQHTISGYLNDVQSGEALTGVHILSEQNRVLGTSNSFGYYCVHLPTTQTAISLKFSMVGYSLQSISLGPADFEQGVCKRNVLLQPGLQLAEVAVRSIGTARNTGGMALIDPQGINKLSSLVGEPDVMKALQLSPGISTAADGSSNLVVRGGSPDQNLVLLDGVPLYYLNHAGGFFSVFDTDAIRQMDVYTGHFPARYGGRLSSVVDIQMKEGNAKKLKAALSLGLLSTKIAFEGPILKDKSSFFVSARRCNFDLISLALLSTQVEPIKAGITFYDVNAKWNLRLSHRNRLYLSFYYSDDKFFFRTKGREVEMGQPRNYNQRNSSRWGNLMGSLRWNSALSESLFANVSVSNVHYRYQTRTLEQINFLNPVSNYDAQQSFDSGIEDWLGRVDFDYFASENTQMRFGVANTWHRFRPSDWRAHSALDNLGDTTQLLQPHIQAHSSVVYVEHQWREIGRFSSNIGLHLSSFYSNRQWFYAPEPRVKVGYHHSEQLDFSLGYSYMRQYLHQVSSGNLGVSFSMWYPTTARIQPESAHQLTMGGQYRTPNQGYLVQIEAYYKQLNHPIEYRDGATVSGRNAGWENEVTTDGSGRAMGIELLLQKKLGRLTGHLSYSLSKSTRRYPEINNGQRYPYQFDRPHNITLMASLKLSQRWNCTANWAYRSGELATVPSSQYPSLGQGIDFDFGAAYQQHIAFDYSGKYTFRYPAYHRLDVAFNYTHEKRKGTNRWNFGIINVYNRMNTSFLYYTTNERGDTKLNRLTLFPIMPSFSYQYSFGK